MTLDESILYNKFHIISIGLRTLQRLGLHSGSREIELTKLNEIVERLIKESDNGMKHILDMAGEKA